MIQFTKLTLITFPAIILVVILVLFIPNEWRLSNLANIINKKLGNASLRNQMLNYIDLNYSTNTSSFLEMLILNQKQYNNPTYKLFIKLNIIHLFIISGLHLSLLNKVIDNIFKNKICVLIISLIINLLFFYITNFSISILRIILVLLIKFISKQKLNNFICNVISGIVIILLFIRDAQTYSFILIYVCICFLSYINIKISNKVVKLLFNIFYLNILTAPISIHFNGSFNILSFLNNFLFSNLIVIMFFLEFLFCWIPNLFSFNESLISNCLLYFEKLANIQSILLINLCNYAICLFYFIHIGLFEYFEWNSIDKNLRCIKNKFNRIY